MDCPEKVDVLNDAIRSRTRIGVLGPFTNSNLEPDMALLQPPETSVHFTRIGGYDAKEIPGSDQMTGMGKASLEEPLYLISGLRPAVVLYACTSATLAHGASFDKQLAEKIKTASGAISLTAAGSLAAALKVMDVKKIGFASPYLGEVNNQAMSFFHNEGIATVNCADIGRPLGNYGQGELSPDEVCELALRADHAEAEAIVLACTDMRAVEVIEKVERALNKPIVTSNQAMMFCAMQALGISRHATAPGRLFNFL